ncbi:MAG: SMC-Scp complex subunit ScpB [Bacteroidetes bacterium]|nr:SMC-Scp complex subunit ScpB [Bacteroidota bacterium]
MADELKNQPIPQADTTDDLFVPDDTLMPIVEALIFASEAPVSLSSLKLLLDEEYAVLGSGGVPEGRIVEVIDRLNRQYEDQKRAFLIRYIADGYLFMTHENQAGWVAKLYRNKQSKRINQTALETLAIIAYKQPISKPEIENIRRASADYSVKILLERNLITVVGRAETVGKPLLYGSTREFLLHFGLKSITELPKLREISEIMKDDEFEFEQQMRIKMEDSDAGNPADTSPEQNDEQLES